MRAHADRRCRVSAFDRPLQAALANKVGFVFALQPVVAWWQENQFANPGAKIDATRAEFDQQGPFLIVIRARGKFDVDARSLLKHPVEGQSGGRHLEAPIIKSPGFA